MDAPSPFVMSAAADVAHRLPGGRALDVAMGSGRHTVPLAELGFRTFGVDRDMVRVRAARRRAGAEGLEVLVWAADLSDFPLPESWFDLIVCTRFLDRALFPALARALRGNGTLVYETFTSRQWKHARGPRSPEHLLKPGELARAFPTLTQRHYEEVESPEAVARLIATR
jgi:SAM-dependent methyltransferase